LTGGENIASLILTSALDADEWLASRSDRFIPGQATRYTEDRRLGGRIGGLDAVTKKDIFNLMREQRKMENK
jgi:hypothetical protein